MAYNFSELQSEVKRRSTRDQGGTQFDTAIKNAINTSLFRISREAPWMQLRRKHVFPTVGQYTTGTLTATNGSNIFTGSGTLFVTNGITVGRRVLIGGSTQRYVITEVNSETQFKTNLNYDQTSASNLTFTFYGQEEYNMPPQLGRIGVVWHEALGFPYTLEYSTDLEFYMASVPIENQNIPIYYRMWGEDWVITQPLEPSVITISSSSSSDVSKSITIFGDVAGYPDSEVIITNGSDGTTTVSSTKTFQNIERVVKSSSTAGRITVTANTGTSTVAVIPAGYTDSGFMYRKVQLWPLPKTVFNINVQYYKEPDRLVNDGDVHELGSEFDEALLLLSCAKIKYQENQKEANNYFSLYQDELRVLRRYNMDRNMDWRPGLKRPSQRRGRRGFLNKNVIWEQLGGNFGPGSTR
jgi:hypothetical protein